MTDNIIDFNGITTQDIDSDKVISSALGKLDFVFIIGYDKNGELYLASSSSDLTKNLWVLEKAKKDILDDIY